MNQDSQYKLLIGSFYDAVTSCDENQINADGDSLFEFLIKDAIQKSSRKYLTFSESTELHTCLDAYQQHLQINADVAETIEAEIYSNISSYSFEKRMDFKNPDLRKKGYSINFKPIQIKAVIDWLDLSFEVNPSRCSFVNKPNARNYIKSFLTMKTGKKHYVKHDDSDINQNGLAFTIRLHDISSKKDLMKIADLLWKQYGADYLRMKISSIELSLDFYNVPNRAFLSALHKSIKYSKTAENFRVYKYVKDDTRNKFTPIPKVPLVLLEKFNNDWCLGVNPKGSPLCYRLYPKTTDSNKQPLPIDKHRLRVEVTLTREFLANTDCHLPNLPNIIKLGFKHLAFNKLDQKASEKMKANYNQHIAAFGMEQNTMSFSRNKRTLANGVKTHSELNSLMSKAIFNLCRKF